MRRRTPDLELPERGESGLGGRLENVEATDLREVAPRQLAAQELHLPDLRLHQGDPDLVRGGKDAGEGRDSHDEPRQGTAAECARESLDAEERIQDEDGRRRRQRPVANAVDLGRQHGEEGHRQQEDRHAVLPPGIPARGPQIPHETPGDDEEENPPDDPVRGFERNGGGGVRENPPGRRGQREIRGVVEGLEQEPFQLSGDLRQGYQRRPVHMHRIQPQAQDRQPVRGGQRGRGDRAVPSQFPEQVAERPARRRQYRGGEDEVEHGRGLEHGERRQQGDAGPSRRQPLPPRGGGSERPVGHHEREPGERRAQREQGRGGPVHPNLERQGRAGDGRRAEGPESAVTGAGEQPEQAPRQQGDPEYAYGPDITMMPEFRHHPVEEVLAEGIQRTAFGDTPPPGLSRCQTPVRLAVDRVFRRVQRPADEVQVSVVDPVLDLRHRKVGRREESQERQEQTEGNETSSRERCRTHRSPGGIPRRCGEPPSPDGDRAGTGGRVPRFVTRRETRIRGAGGRGRRTNLRARRPPGVPGGSKPGALNGEP